jgi:hypothetical protein
MLKKFMVCPLPLWNSGKYKIVSSEAVEAPPPPPHECLHILLLLLLLSPPPPPCPKEVQRLDHTTKVYYS